MKRTLLTLVTPPFAVCKYGCATCCAAPVGVFWITGIFAICYGMAGGPASRLSPSWITVLVGLALWGMAVAWAALAVQGAPEQSCAEGSNLSCNRSVSDGGAAVSLGRTDKRR